MRAALFIMLFSIYCNVFAQNITLLNSDAGGKMLVSSINSGYAKQFLSEVKYFTYQENTSYCGVATAAIILNTLSITPPEDKNFGKYKLFTQNNLFTADMIRKTGLTESSILGHGLTLAQETQLLNSFDGIKARAYPLESLTETQSKKIILHALKSNNQLVIANILRDSMQESGGGHLSPVVAYAPKSDDVLFLDVTSFKPYGPTWVPFHVLYNAMHTKDGNSYRGFILVSKTKEQH